MAANPPIFEQQAPQVEPIFAEPPKPEVSSELATNKALSDSFVASEPAPLDAYKAARQQGTTLRDSAIQMLYDELGEQFVGEQLWGKVLKNPESSLEDLQWAVQTGTKSLRFRDLNREQTLLIATVLGNKENLNIDSSFLDKAQSGRIQDIDAIRQNLAETANAVSSHTIDEYVAGMGWDNAAKGVAEGLFNELTPIVNVGTKSAITSAFFDPLNLDWQGGKLILLGEARQAIRDSLVALSPEAREEAMTEIVANVKALQADPAWGAAITNYAILEAFENVFTDEVLAGETGKHTIDRVIGNMETAFEALWAGWIAVRAGKTIRSMRRASDSLEVSRVARAVADRPTQTRAMKWLQSEINKETGISPAEVAVGRLPSPSPLEDSRLVEFAGAREAIDQAEHIVRQSKVHKQNPIGQALTGREKQNVIAAEVELLTRGNSTAVQPSMSVIEEADDLSGIKFKVVLSKSDDEAFPSLSEVFSEIDQSDPLLEHTKVMRRGTDGTLEEVKFASADELLAVASQDFKSMSDSELLMASKGLSRQDPVFKMLDREAQIRAGQPRTVDEIAGDEFFLEVETFRPFHPVDKTTMPATGLRNTWLPDWFLTPNTRFSERGMVEAMTSAVQDDQRLVRNLERIVSPYFKLGNNGKRRVNIVTDWLEREVTRTGREPSLYDVLSEFPDLTAVERAGYISLRRAYEFQEDILNTRLYNDYRGLGFKTATPVDPTLPRWHGKAVPREGIGKTTAYNPETQEMVTLSKKDMDALYERGGSLMKLDSRHEVPLGDGKEFYSQVLLPPGRYKVGDLSPRPFDELRYPGYNFRFYDDPYYIVKELDATVDGVKASGPPTSVAMRTAPSELQAVNSLNRMASPVLDSSGKTKHWVDRTDPSIKYRFVKSRDIEQSDRVLLQKDVLHKEGRLFWDQRNREVLPSIGKPDSLLDSVRALDRGLQLVARQSTTEDLMRTLRQGFTNEFKGLPGLQKLDLMVADTGTIIKNLRTEIRQAATAGDKEVLTRALKYAQYIRSMDGVQSTAIPRVRSFLLKAATQADRIFNRYTAKEGTFAGLEKWALRVDPIKAARKVPFLLYMRFKPFRQYALQGAQPLALTGLDPLYILSGRGLNDAWALRRGFLRSLATTPDELEYSHKWLARRMGLSSKEFKKLVSEIEKDGLIDEVNVHAFPGGQKGFHRLTLPDQSLVGETGHKVKQGGQYVSDVFQKGFDEGEMLNKYGTFNIAWRRVMRKRGHKSLLDLTPDDWRQVRLDAENLTFHMSPANRAAYQDGMLSVSTQFIAFTHRFALAVLGQNPAIKNGDLVRMWAGGLATMGAGYLGADKLVREALDSLDVGDIESEAMLMPDGSTMVDYLTSGLIETVLNKLGTHTFEEQWTELDLQNNLPIMNPWQYAQMFYEGVQDNLILGFAGPAGNVTGDIMEGTKFLEHAIQGWPSIQGSPYDKATWMMSMFAANVVPFYRDTTLAYLAYEMDKQVSLAGRPNELQTTLNSLLAKGTFGINTKEQAANWNLIDDERELKALQEDLIDGGRKFLRQLLFLRNKGDLSKEKMFEYAAVAGEIALMAPEGIRQEVYEGILGVYYGTDNEEETLLATLAKQAGFLDGSAYRSHVKELERRGTLTPVQADALIKLSDDILNTKELKQSEIYDIVTKRGAQK